MKALKDKPKLGFKKLPSWFKQDIPDKNKTRYLKGILDKANLHTVCQSALCPNQGICWGRGAATFMILGDVCTRSCRFCAVKNGTPLAVDENEPENVALTVKKLGLRYVVVTSVTRDDLSDKGCGQFVKTIVNIKKINPGTKVEVLIPDIENNLELLRRLTEAQPDVIGHNIEMVKRIFSNLRPQAGYERSLSVLKNLKSLSLKNYIKSGFMVGLGETYDEVVSLMKDIFNAGCDILTVGQYLSPGITGRNVKETRFVLPDEFEGYKEIGYKIGFKYVLSGPLVRSSFLAEDAFNSVSKSPFITSEVSI